MCKHKQWQDKSHITKSQPIGITHTLLTNGGVRVKTR